MVLIEYPLVSRESARWLGRAVPTVEIAIGLLLLSGSAWLPRLGLVAALGSLTAVTVVIGLRLARGERRFRCGCSNDLARVHSAHLLLARNIGLLALTGALLYLPSSTLGLPALLSGIGFFAVGQLTMAAGQAREAITEWKASG